MKLLASISDFKKVSFSAAVISASALFGLDFKVERNIPYRSPESFAQEGEYARSRCLLDMRVPVGVTNFATVIHFHGGGIVKGNKGSFSWPDEAYKDDPIAQVSGGYRLLTNATPEQAVSDAAAAVAWTLKNISRYGGDPKKVFVTGISAGGYLTAMVGLDYRWLAKHDLKPTDLAGIIPLTGQMTKHFNVREIGFKDTDPRYMPKVDEWAPLHYATDKNPLPPSCFLTGGRDLEMKARVEENELLVASLRACGHKNVEFRETEGSHGGGVYPSRYFLRDFVMKTCNAGGIPRFSDGECTVLTGDKMPDSLVAPYLQLFWSTRCPGSEVKVVAATFDEMNQKNVRFGFKPDRVWTFGEDETDCQGWAGLGVKQILRLTQSPKCMDDVLFDPGRHLKVSDVSPKAKDLFTAMLLLDTMRICPLVSRIAIDAKKGVAFPASSKRHTNAAGKKLPDCFNVKVPRVDVRKNGLAFTYAPKALPFPVTPEYKEVEKFYPLTERFNQEILSVERLPQGTYELAFDGVKVGEFTAGEFEKGINISSLDTPNQRKAVSLVKHVEFLHGAYSAMAKKRMSETKAKMEDVYEMLNAVRPAVSRVTLKLKAK